MENLSEKRFKNAPALQLKSKIEVELEKMLDAYVSNKKLSNEQKINAVIILTDFLKGKDLELNYSTGHDSRLLDALITGLLMIIHLDENNAIRAKEKIAQALNPLNNQVLLKQVIDNYNKAKDSVSKIKSVTPLVKLIIQKTFYYNFNHLLDNRWMQEHKNELGPGFIGFFILHFYFQFNYFYNEYIKNPEKFPQIQAQLNPKLSTSTPSKERSSYEVNDIIKYIYGTGGKFNPKIADAFSKANEEIIASLKKEIPNQKVSKLFKYIIANKLDPEEIIELDKDFKSNTDVTGGFNNFSTKNPKAVSIIDNIYKKHRLKLPTFSKWKASDLNKSASDRGELKADSPEFGADKKGNLSKISYNKFGEPTYTNLQELRLIIRSVLSENIKQLNII